MEAGQPPASVTPWLGWGWADDGIDLASEESGAAETETQPGPGQTPDTVIMATY